MNRLLCLLLALTTVLTVPAQKKKTVQRKPAVAAKNQKPKAATKKQPAVTVKSLQNQRQQIQKNIKEQERRLLNNQRDVKQRLQNLMVINTEIDDKRRTIDTIRRDISNLDGSIDELGSQLKRFEKELDGRKQRYMMSMRYMHRNRNIQNRLMFIFSARNFSQMYRRLRFVREYANHQKAQGDAVKAMYEQVSQAREELSDAKRQKNNLLFKGEQEKKNLEGKQQEQQQVVTTLQKQQKTIQAVIDQQKKKDAQLNAQIDKLVQEEVARARARALAEAKKKAAAEAAKKRAEELARKKAAAEAAARENARRIAEAKAREEKAKAEARAAAKKSAEEKARAERAAREAEKTRREEERRAAAEKRMRDKEVADAKKKSDETSDFTVTTEDRRLSGNFESNRGRLPMPITGPYKIVTHFGQYNVEGLTNVRLDNKGINIRGQAGARERSIFDGEVSAVFGYAGSMGVIVRHGNYLSVYCNLSSVSVSRGQKVSARQVLGAVGSENILQFQLRRNVDKLNPEAWLGR